MKISIFGLGYVGYISLGCLAKMGHKVIGADINPNKIDLSNNGKTTIIETTIGEIIEKAYKKVIISATNDMEYAILNTDLTLIAVGTPSSETGHTELKYVNNSFHALKISFANEIGNICKALSIDSH